MLSTASWTAMARLREISPREAAVVGALVGSLTAIGLVFALRLVTGRQASDRRGLRRSRSAT